jgi:integrase
MRPSSPLMMSSALQEQLGYHSAAFTLDVYGHVTESMQAEAASRVGALLGGS